MCDLLKNFLFFTSIIKRGKGLKMILAACQNLEFLVLILHRAAAVNLISNQSLSVLMAHVAQNQLCSSGQTFIQEYSL